MKYTLVCRHYEKARRVQLYESGRPEFASAMHSGRRKGNKSRRAYWEAFRPGSFRCLCVSQPSRKKRVYFPSWRFDFPDAKGRAEVRG
jgi:hypothetical protein